MKRAFGLTALLCLASAGALGAQGLRTVIAGVVTLDPAKPEGTVVSLRYNEAVAIAYPADTLFIQGMEFELRIPKAVQGSESSIAWSVYSRLSPAPAIDRFDYAADLIATQALPSRVTLSLILPTSERHALRSGPYASLIPSVAGPDRFPVVFKLSSIGKGIVPAVENAEFKLTVRPILTDEGGLALSVAFPEGADKAPLSVYVDDRRADDPFAVILARKGARVLRVSAEGYREEVLTVAVEAGRVAPVAITLTPNAPLLVFQAPAGAVIMVDGQAVKPADMDGFSVEPGEHSLSCRIGDYAITRKFMALRGKTYEIVLSVELEILAQP